MSSEQEIPDGEPKVAINFQVEKSLHTRIKAAAKKKGVTIAGWTRMKLIDALETEGQ